MIDAPGPEAPLGALAIEADGSTRPGGPPADGAGLEVTASLLTLGREASARAPGAVPPAVVAPWARAIGAGGSGRTTGPVLGAGAGAVLASLAERSTEALLPITEGVEDDSDDDVILEPADGPFDPPPPVAAGELGRTDGRAGDGEAARVADRWTGPPAELAGGAAGSDASDGEDPVRPPPGAVLAAAGEAAAVGEPTPPG